MIFNRRRGKKKKDQEDSNEQVDPNEAPEGDQDMEENPEGENPGSFYHDPTDRPDSGYPRGPGRGRGGGQRGGYNNNRPRTGPPGSDAGCDKPETGKDGASTEYGTANSESPAKKRTTSTSSTSSYTQGVSKLFERMKTDSAQGESFKIPKINKPTSKPNEGESKPTSGKSKPNVGPGPEKNQPGASDAIEMLKAKARGRDKSKDKNKSSGSRSGSHSSVRSDASAKRGRSSSAGAERKKPKKKEK